MSATPFVANHDFKPSETLKTSVVEDLVTADVNLQGDCLLDAFSTVRLQVCLYIILGFLNLKF